MLVLTRKKGEEIVIGDNIVIKIQEIGSENVKISIDAPRNITVLRGELVQAVNENKIAALTKKSNEEIKNQMDLLNTLIKGKNTK